MSIPKYTLPRALQLVLIVLVSFLAPIIIPQAKADSPLMEMLEASRKSLLQGHGFIIIRTDSSNAVTVSPTAQAADMSARNNQKKTPPTEISLAQVAKEAEYASQVTGIRKDYLMGALTVESELGQNTGQCTYREVYDGASDLHDRGVLSDRSWQTFLERERKIRKIAEELGYDYEEVKVSCNPDPNLYVGTGGALGLPQFMPDTWYEYYDRIKAITGKEHPDPWDVRDGVLAMALKLSDVPGVRQHNVWAERAASKLYLSGTTSWQYDWYATEIQYWANNYTKLLTT